jgi:hypothetical protein
MTRREINKNKAQHFLQKSRNLVYTNQLISFIKIREIAAIIFSNHRISQDMTTKPH